MLNNQLIPVLFRVSKGLWPSLIAVRHFKPLHWWRCLRIGLIIENLEKLFGFLGQTFWVWWPTFWNNMSVPSKTGWLTPQRIGFWKSFLKLLSTRCIGIENCWSCAKTSGRSPFLELSPNWSQLPHWNWFIETSCPLCGLNSWKKSTVVCL